MGLVALADAASGAPVCYDVPGVGKVETRLPRLYATWVIGPRFVAAPPAEFLLGSADLEGQVASVLDTTVLDRIAAEALAGIEATRPRPYLAEKLHLFLTATNIQGIPYQVSFASLGGSESYVMTCHADRVHFTLINLGTACEASPWADPDPAFELDMASLAGATAPHETPSWAGYIDATLGSSAFPAGLRARALPPLPGPDLAKRQWPLRTDRTGPDRFQLRPAWTDAHTATPIPRAALDGGIIDNEPFELARWALMASPPERNERDVRKAARAVLMIDPFPSEPVELPADPDRFLLGVLARFIPLLIGQARFKLDAVVGALDPAVGSRFLISPRRYTQHNGTWNEKPEPHGIACGLLGGFGGFLSEAFRAHDYQLGRLNAYRFLKNHFCYPCDHDVLTEGYASFPSLERFRGADADTPGEPDPRRYQMIPVLDTVKPPAEPAWPRVSQQQVDEFVAAASQRANKLAGKLMDDHLSAWPKRYGAKFVWWKWGRDGVAENIRYTLLRELHLRDQLEGLSAKLSEDGRKVLAALCDISFDARTPEGIAAEYVLNAPCVSALIENQATILPLVEQGPVYGSWRLRARRPGRFERIFSGPPRIG